METIFFFFSLKLFMRALSLLLVASSTLAFTHTKLSTFKPRTHRSSAILHASSSEGEEAEKKKVLDTVLSSIERNYGRGSIMRLGDNDA